MYIKTEVNSIDAEVEDDSGISVIGSDTKRKIS